MTTEEVIEQFSSMEVGGHSDSDRAFFEKIRRGDVKAVCDYIDKNSNLRPFNNERGESAAAVALKSRKLAVYEALITRNWRLSSSEDIEKIGNRWGKNLADKLKHELRLIHKFFIKNPNKEHLTSLINKTRIYEGESLETNNRIHYRNLIAGAYEDINEIPEIRAIIELVANVKNLQIIFDFNRDSIAHADPTGNDNVYGKTYADKGEVYIGAKGLKDKNHSEQFPEVGSEIVATGFVNSDDDDDKVKRMEVLGVVAHELCHVAMYRIYNNDYNPYHKDDSVNKKEFENVVNHCRINPYTEEIVALVLNGPKNFMHDELIVRVPHMLALYQGNNDKIKLLKETYEKVFAYFETKTLPDIKKEIEFMPAVEKLRLKEPQHLRDSKICLRQITDGPNLDLTGILEISSNCPQITMHWIFQETSKPEFNFLFLALYHLKDEETYKLLRKAHSSCMEPRIVIDCDNEITTEIKKIAEKMRNDIIKERIIFVHNYEHSLIKDATLQTINHSWIDLEEQSKKKLVETMVNFQGENILLKEITEHNCDAMDKVSLKKLLDNYLKIGCDLDIPESIHVKRKFFSETYGVIQTNQLLPLKVIILSDDPGMGKTTELKMLATEFKKNFKNSWVAFVDLKKHSEFYEKDENFKTNFNSSKEIANFYAKKIFKLNEFEERIFKSLFKVGRVVLLLDGFDEISPSFKKFVTMLIKSIKKHSGTIGEQKTEYTIQKGNILITSTRPHLKEELSNKLAIEAYTLMSLTVQDCEVILKKSLEKYGITGEALNRKCVQTKDFLIELTKQPYPVTNPLILRVIAKVFTDNQFADETRPNIFSIYENFIKIMIKESMKKGDHSRQEATIYFTSEFNIFPFYQNEALKLLIKDYRPDEFKKFFNLCVSDDQSNHDERMVRVALMKKCSENESIPENFQFIHQTFAEFFVAYFLFKNVFDCRVFNERKQKYLINEKQSIYVIVRKVFADETEYKQVQSFIYGALDNLIPDFEIKNKKEFINNKITELEKNLNRWSFNSYSIKKNLRAKKGKVLKLRCVSV